MTALLLTIQQMLSKQDLQWVFTWLLLKIQIGAKIAGIPQSQSCIIPSQIARLNHAAYLFIEKFLIV